MSRERTVIDETAFIATIRANGDARGPRLVYADWLEEQGRTVRAEYLRLCCASNSERAAAEFLHAHGAEATGWRWLSAFPTPSSLRLGFYTRAHMPLEAAVDFGDLIIPFYPLAALEVSTLKDQAFADPLVVRLRERWPAVSITLVSVGISADYRTGRTMSFTSTQVMMSSYTSPGFAVSSTRTR